MTWYMQSYLPPPAYIVRPEVRIELSKKAPPPPMPVELKASLGDKEFADRMQTILTLLGRYTWSNMMRGFTVVAFFMTFVLPIPMIIVVNRVVATQAFDEEGDLVNPDKLHEARGIDAAIFFGSFLLFMVPWYLFKRHAEKSIQSAMQRFTTSDQAKGSMQNLSWRILKHSTFTQKAVLAVQLPSSYTGAPSAFHPQAYNNWSTYAPPTYVAPPAASQDLYQPPSDPPKEPVYPPPPREPADAGIPTGQQPGHL